MKILEINKKKYPVSFGKGFLLRLERDYKIDIKDIESLFEKKPFETIPNVIMAALDEGARIEKKEHKLYIYDIMDAWDYDENLIQSFFELFNESQSKEGEKKIIKTDSEST